MRIKQSGHRGWPSLIGSEMLLVCDKDRHASGIPLRPATVPIFLEDEFQRQSVLLHVEHSQGGKESTQLPSDGGHDLSKKVVQLRDLREPIETCAKCFVRLG